MSRSRHRLFPPIPLHGDDDSVAGACGGMRVLSIQSHVVHGCVGNRAATFPLQLLGFEVDPLNTVHLSNHTGYAVWKGTRMSPQEFDDIVTGLDVNGFLATYSHVLTGYIGSAPLLRRVVALVDRIRAQRAGDGRAPDMAFVCDPVLGDNGKLYCPAEMVEVYRDEALPRADLITPNSFEASILSGVPVVDLPSAERACDALHARGAAAVVIKSINIGDEVWLVGSDRITESRFHLHVGRRVPYLSGLGDLMAALLLGHSARCRTLADAVLAATASVQAVLQHTLQRGVGELCVAACATTLRRPDTGAWRVRPVPFAAAAAAGGGGGGGGGGDGGAVADGTSQPAAGGAS